MLNRAPNRNDATGVANNVCLTTMGAKQFTVAIVYLVIIQKINLPKMRDNDTKQQRFVQKEINIYWERMKAICPVV